MRSIDLHSHILPGVDDGPAAIEGSLALARAAAAAGTATIVATPHVNEDRLIAPAHIPRAAAALDERIRAEGIELEVVPGGEIALRRLLDLTEEELASLGLGGGPYLLLESPFAGVADDFEAVIEDVLARGHRVLLAHPERCPTFQRDPGRLAPLVEAGVLVQLTAGALTGDFGSRVRASALELLRAELVHVIASDAHNDGMRPPGILDAVAEIEADMPGIGERADWMCREVPAAILAGDPIPEPAPLPAVRPGAWRRLAVAARRR